jgi:hypothetical protein
MRLLKNYHHSTICRSESDLIDYRLYIERTFSAVSKSGGFHQAATIVVCSIVLKSPTPNLHPPL